MQQIKTIQLITNIPLQNNPTPIPKEPLPLPLFYRFLLPYIPPSHGLLSLHTELNSALV